MQLIYRDTSGIKNLRYFHGIDDLKFNLLPIFMFTQ